MGRPVVAWKLREPHEFLGKKLSTNERCGGAVITTYFDQIIGRFVGNDVRSFRCEIGLLLT